MNPAPNFDRLASVYRWMEFASFGPTLWRCRRHFLDELRGSRKALVLGDGDGRFTAKLLDANPEIVVDAVDASGAMLESLSRRTGQHRGRVRTHRADARTWEPVGQKYDLVVSHFFLDCLTTDEVGALVHRVRRHLDPDALWLVSEFAVPENRFGRMVAGPLVSGLYLVFRGLTGLPVQRLPRYDKVFLQEHLACDQRKFFLNELLVTELWRTDSKALLQAC